MALYPFDDAYVARLRAGDPFTQKHFHDFFERRLKSRLYHRGARPSHDIEDLVQEGFVRAWRTILSPEGIRDGRTLASFMFSVCKNVHLEWCRRKVPEPMPDDVVDESEENAFTALVRSEERQKVMRVLERLPAKDQALLRALYWEELDKDEICRRFSVSRDYLRVLQHRAVAKFLSEWKGEKGKGKEKENEAKNNDE